ncbi:MAG TPA: stage III sporulation protein AA [Syntrophomonadaceae bacterium]|nr:stage III sporulation protein AA [Syntrophomonadaceae bacterium]
MIGNDGAKISREVLPYLSPAIRKLVGNLEEHQLAGLEELRLRCGQPLFLKFADQDRTLNSQGKLQADLTRGYQTTLEDVQRTLASISDNSIYAFEEDIRRGFITIPGGHRVGLAGQVVSHEGSIKTIKDFSSLCIRIAREVRGAARPLLAQICPDKANIRNTLIISPPRCGKTTLLRDLACSLSNGDRGRSGLNVVVVDERSELAGSYRGVPQLDVGMRSDVLDSCPKALGMNIAVRALSPQLVITDELGRREDGEAVMECINAGVKVISSIHASNLDELSKRPLMQELLACHAFQLGIVLSRARGPGTVETLIRWDEGCS